MLLRAAAILAATLAAAGIACAQENYPSKPIRVVVPWSPGGIVDIGARIVSEKLSQNLGNPVIVENKPGANGFIGTEQVAKAAPDGYTLLFISTTTHVVAPALYRKMPYDPVKDFDPVSQITLAPTIAVAPPNSPYKTLADLVAAAKANPGKLNYATYGAGGSSQLAATLFMQAAGIEMTAIPYKAATPAVTGLMGGETDLFFDSIPSSLNHVKAGRLKAFAVTSEARVAAAPEIPALAEFYPGVTFNVWQGVEAPAGTPKSIVNRLHAEIVKVIDNPEVRDKLLKLGAFAVSSKSPEEFGQYIVREKAKMENLIRRAGIPYVE
jgi:tripartite-type tricarboxylate transporter receptor subunit TctC